LELHVSLRYSPILDGLGTLPKWLHISGWSDGWRYSRRFNVSGLGPVRIQPSAPRTSTPAGDIHTRDLGRARARCGQAGRSVQSEHSVDICPVYSSTVYPSGKRLAMWRLQRWASFCSAQRNFCYGDGNSVVHVPLRFCLPPFGDDSE